MDVLKPILRRLYFSPRRVAVVDDQRAWKNYEIAVAALHMARKIEAMTDRPHVGVMLPTSALTPIAVVAIWMLGRTVVPVNYLLKEEDRAFMMSDAEIDTLITVGPMVEQFGAPPEGVQEIRMDEMSFKGFPPLRRTVKRPSDHLAVLLYTSGTSGRPKGVMLTSGNLASNVRQCTEWAHFTNRDKLLGVLPQFHSFGLTVLTILPLTIGATVVYTARFMPKKILSLLKAHKPTALIAIPSMYNALLSAKSATREHFESLTWVVSGGEPLPAAVFDGFREHFDVVINEGYGLTETGPVANWCRPDDHRRHSVGMAIPRVEEKIIDGEGRSLGANEEGEVLIRGPNIMKGYYKLPDETAAVFDGDGYFKTGDMGRIDEEGHLFITGRIKEMLIIGGENVFPREIEEVLDKHPSVHASAVIGVEDASRGEVAMAFVELEDGAEFNERELRSHCREGLPQYKVPREIRCLEELPRNPTGKIMRRELTSETPSKA